MQSLTTQIDNILAKSQIHKLTKEERGTLKSYAKNSMAGAGNSKLSLTVAGRVEKIKNLLNLHSPACVGYDAKKGMERIKCRQEMAESVRNSILSIRKGEPEDHRATPSYFSDLSLLYDSMGKKIPEGETRNNGFGTWSTHSGKVLGHSECQRIGDRVCDELSFTREEALARLGIEENNTGLPRFSVGQEVEWLGTPGYQVKVVHNSNPFGRLCREGVPYWVSGQETTEVVPGENGYYYVENKHGGCTVAESELRVPKSNKLGA